jgi:hypothetical protein
VVKCELAAEGINMTQSSDRVEVGHLSGAEEAQRDSMPKEDLARFAGEWVALRRGHVVDHDRDLAALRSRPDVRIDDVFLPVPRPRETGRV